MVRSALRTGCTRWRSCVRLTTFGEALELERAASTSRATCSTRSSLTPAALPDHVRACATTTASGQLLFAYLHKGGYLPGPTTSSRSTGSACRRVIGFAMNLRSLQERIDAPSSSTGAATICGSLRAAGIGVTWAAACAASPRSRIAPYCDEVLPDEFRSRSSTPAGEASGRREWGCSLA